MKKYLLIFLLLLTFNVSAATCTYEVDKNNYSIDFGIDNKWYHFGDWKYSYTVNGQALNESSYKMGEITIVSGTESIFNKIKTFGDVPDNFSCPVLVFVGNDKYTLMPYDTYISFFAPENTIKCSTCSDEEIELKNYRGNTMKYTFSQFCDEMVKTEYVHENGNAVEVSTSIPFVGYFKHNSYFGSSNRIGGVCAYYDKKDTPVGNFKSYFNKYSEWFILGESDSVSVCPSVLNADDNQEIMNCLRDKSTNLKGAINNFNKSCTENEMRAIQSFASGSTGAFFAKRSVSAYLNNEIKMLFGTFSGGCGSAADGLYDAIGNAARVLNSYSGHEEITTRMRYMSLESDYLIAYSLLTNVNPNVKVEDDSCDLISSELREYISEILNALRICGVLLVVLLSVVEIYKAITSSDESVKKKVTSLVGKRIAALVVILALPMIINILLDLINDYMPTDTSQCVVNDLINQE